MFEELRQQPEDTQPAADVHVRAQEPAIGDRVGRYILLKRVGAGGMGVVFQARDPELDRDVALKLVHPKEHQSTVQRERLKREALALAKLAHPNVVTVYEVGSFGDDVFIAMEFVRGSTLRAWLEDAKPRRRSWRVVLEVMRAAGRGLAAAHAAGLVHRDFKPDNVIVGGDGRVRVLDFGLAFPTAEPEPSPEVPPDSEMAERKQQPTANDLTSERLTATGTTVGTPLYLAPERMSERPVDAKADQFSYCVALWEALYGQRPFAGKKLSELVAAARAGQFLPPPPKHGAPHWLHRVCVRGLSGDPERRFPSMAALLEALDRERARAWRKRVLAGMAAVGAGVLTVVLAQVGDERRRIAACEFEGLEIADVWNDDKRRALEEALLGTGRDYAKKTTEAAVAALDAHSADWQQARSSACISTKVRHIWDKDTLERAVWCLDERKTYLAILLNELTSRPYKALPKVWEATAKLRPPNFCTDRERLDRSLLPPVETRAAVQAVHRDLIQASILEYSGEYDKASELTETSLATAQTLGWPTLTITALIRKAVLLDRRGARAEAESIYEDAYFLALAGNRAPETAAAIAQQLVIIVGARLHRHTEARRWSRSAEAVAADLPDDPIRRAMLLQALAAVAQDTGNYAEARALSGRVLEIERAHYGAEHPDVATALGNLGIVLGELGELEEATRLLEQAVAIGEKALGPDHPMVANFLDSLANQMIHAARYGDARPLSARALAIRTAAFGDDNVHVGRSLNNLGNIDQELGNRAAARERFGRALTIFERTVGPDDELVAMALSNLAALETIDEAYPQAEAHMLRVITIRETIFGPDHQAVARALGNLAIVRAGMGDFDTARIDLSRALAIFERTFGPESSNLTEPLRHLVEVELKLGAHADALAHAERVFALTEANEARRDTHASARFILAKARWETSTRHAANRAIALAMAQEAYEDYRGFAPKASALAEMEAWLRARGGTVAPTDEHDTP